MDCICGTPIEWAEDIATGHKVKLEVVQVTMGRRYRDAGFNPRKVQEITGGSHLGYPVHECERAAA